MPLCNWDDDCDLATPPFFSNDAVCKYFDDVALWGMHDTDPDLEDERIALLKETAACNNHTKQLTDGDFPLECKYHNSSNPYNRDDFVVGYVWLSAILMGLFVVCGGFMAAR
jgi:hypothetical protein